MTARQILLANAWFTAASAVVIFAAREHLYPLFALDSATLLVVVSVMLLLYAASLAIVVRREPPDRRTLLGAALLDAGWVVGTAIVLVAAWSALAPAGRLLLIAAALIVELFATVQFRLARSLAVQGRAAAPQLP